MKLNKITYMLAALAACLFTGCSDDDIHFDYEAPQFETRADAILLEVVMPQATNADDKIYIVGAFNGGEEAIGNPLWQLEKCRNNDVKWGIYLNPSTFVDGKTLADGYTFYNATQGFERTVKGEEVTRNDNPSVGTRTNITVTRWQAYFDSQKDPSDIEHDGYVIYVVDNSGYDELAMYAWGDAEAFGGWPGMTPTGTVGEYKYFDTGADNAGLNLNLIFNNNGGGEQLADYNVTLNQDYYLELTPDGVKEYDPNAQVEHDGYAVFVSNMTGWANEDVRLYMWGDVNDLNGGWPGMEPTGTVVINEVTYLYFDFGEANTGLGENLIFSNNGDSQLSDFAFTIDRDVYVEITTSGVTEIDPATYKPGDAPEPEPDPETTTYYIYVDNQTGWDAISVYAWGDKEYFGGWPGREPDGTQTIAGTEYVYWVVEGYGQAENLIFNNNGGGQQLADFSVTFDQNYFLTVSTAGVQTKKRTK